MSPSFFHISVNGDTQCRLTETSVVWAQPDGVGLTEFYRRCKASASGSYGNLWFPWWRESEILEPLDPEGEADNA